MNNTLEVSRKVREAGPQGRIDSLHTLNQRVGSARWGCVVGVAQSEMVLWQKKTSKGAVIWFIAHCVDRNL